MTTSDSLPRFLARPLLGLALGAGVALFAWWSPLSPAALDRPDSLAAQGDVQGAIAAYTALSDSFFTKRSTREEAAYRAARLAALETADAMDAAARLEGFLADWPGSRYRAEALLTLAALASGPLADPARAARAWEQAAWADADAPEAGSWLVHAGRAWAEAGDTAAAVRALQMATAHPAHAAAAWLALGRVQLGVDAALAHESYQAALAAAATPDEAALARLGLATAVERLEGPNAALAILDDDSTEDPALARRRARLSP